jgi:hypothetical protein
MSLINNTYFIANLDLPGKGNAGVTELLNIMIGRYEPELLQKALGYGFAKLFTDAIAAATEQAPLAQRWIDLRDGKEYVVDGRTFKWKGFADSTLKISLIANYVYYKYRKYTATLTDNIGESKPKSINADSVSANQKMVDAWNGMVEMLYSLYHFLDNNADTYPEYDGSLTDIYILQNINTFGL